MTSAVIFPKDHSDINRFCCDTFRRSILKFFIEEVEKYPNKYSIAITQDDFYVNFDKFLNKDGYTITLKSFRQFWATSGNRQLMIRELKFALGEKLAKGQLFMLLPLQMSNTCINSYRAMIKQK